MYFFVNTCNRKNNKFLGVAQLVARYLRVVGRTSQKAPAERFGAVRLPKARSRASECIERGTTTMRRQRGNASSVRISEADEVTSNQTSTVIMIRKRIVNAVLLFIQKS